MLLRVLLLANNWAGWQIAESLRQFQDEIVGVVIHPPDRRSYTREILQASNFSEEQSVLATELGDPDVLQRITALEADIALSVFFGYVLRKPFLSLFPDACINIHPALLPFNRGANPNVWSIVDQTPAGVSMHYIDPGIDTGEIVAQREVPGSPTDTGESLYRKLEKDCVSLFQDTWPLVQRGQAPRVAQDPTSGTVHRARDLETIDEIHLDRSYPARTLIDILRARTFPPHSGAYFRQDGKKVYLRLQLLTGDETA